MYAEGLNSTTSSVRMPTPGLCRVNRKFHGQYSSSGDRCRHNTYPQGLVRLLRMRMLAPSPSTEGA